MSLLSSIGSVVSSAAKVLGPVAPIIGAGISYLGGRQQNVASAQAAQRQMDFQAGMSDTSYQRQIADLKAAGINPMLVSRLGGASTPAGAMPQFVNPGFQAGQIFSGLQSSAASAQQAQTQENLSQSQIRQVEAAADKIREEIKNIPIEGERLRAATYMLMEQVGLMNQQGYTQVEQQKVLRATAAKLVQETELLTGSVNAMKQLDEIGKTAEAAKPIVDVLKFFLGRK